MVSQSDFQKRNGHTHSDGKDGCHPVEIVGMDTHLEDLGDDRLPRPLDTKDVGELLQVDSGCLTDAEDGVTKP